MANRFKENEPKEVKNTLVQKEVACDEEVAVFVPIEPEEEVIEKVMVVAVNKESRSKRVNLLVKPSVYKAVQKKAKKLGVSVNECMNQLLEQWVAE